VPLEHSKKFQNKSSIAECASAHYSAAARGAVWLRTCATFMPLTGWSSPHTALPGSGLWRWFVGRRVRPLALAGLCRHGGLGQTLEPSHLHVVCCPLIGVFSSFALHTIFAFKPWKCRYTGTEGVHTYSVLCTQKHMLGAIGARKVRDKGELEIRES
jgi:hypothetical protein